MAFTLDERVRKTYFSLRVGTAILGIVLPPLLLLGGARSGISWQPSISAYYHATHEIQTPSTKPYPPNVLYSNLPAGTMRNWFVGILFAVGGMLYVNKGFSEKENEALNLAGVMAFGIALFPMPWAYKPEGWITAHGVCAMGFFLCIAYVCEYCSAETLEELEKENKRLVPRFRMAYRLLAILMVVLPLSALVLHYTPVIGERWLFFAEFFAIYVFATFWLVKTYEIEIISRQSIRGSVAAAAKVKAAA